MAILFSPSLYATVAATFLPWYLWEMPVRIVKKYVEYATAIGAIFSFIFLVKYLFAPWKSLTDNYPENSFQISEMIAVWCLNTISRTIGAFIRVTTLITGLAAQAACLTVFATFLGAWLAFPIVLPLGVQFILQHF